MTKRTKRRRVRRNPFSLERESVAEQKARLLREAEAEKKRKQREDLADRAGKRLQGSRGSIGQKDMFGGGDLFSNSRKMKAKRRHKKSRARKLRNLTPKPKVRRRRRRLARRVRRNSRRAPRVITKARTIIRKVRVKAKHRKASPGFYGYATSGGTALLRVCGSKVKKVGTFKRAGLKRYCAKHGIKVR